MRESSHNVLPTAGVPSVLAVTTFTTPSGIPARLQSIARAEVVMGVSGDGFTTIVHPAAKAVVIFRSAMTTGKFHLSINRSTTARPSLKLTDREGRRDQWLDE